MRAETGGFNPGIELATSYVRNAFNRWVSLPKELTLFGCFIALFNPVGEYLQMTGHGPDWLRWHLSDVGFAPWYAMWLYTFSGLGLNKAILLSLALGVLYEVFQMVMNNGFISDVAALSIGAGAVFYAVNRVRAREP